MKIKAETPVEEMMQKQDDYFDKLNSDELKRIGKNFTDDERKDVVAILPSKYLEEELGRREKVALDIINELMQTLASIYGSQMKLQEMEELIAKVRKIVKVKVNEDE